MFQLLLAVIYLSFISLGLPGSLLGSVWPSIYGELGVPVSYAGAVSMIIALGRAPIYPCIIHSTPAHFGAEPYRRMDEGAARPPKRQLKDGGVGGIIEAI